eukprot:TRINITY_DN42069_c0_g1_i1.p1 TRINITY_DN42069_c0_g1~~TRINITY_DN42069_c0_g1_i1.p1  ORF type:complete len:679 (+),score=119.50 TRINITY_DN42069_c0_g1_i1:93-2129(+)
MASSKKRKLDTHDEQSSNRISLRDSFQNWGRNVREEVQSWNGHAGAVRDATSDNSNQLCDLSDGPRAIDECTVWIGKLPKSVTSKFDVGDAFTHQIGEVTHVHIKEDLQHGFVHFSSAVLAAKALQQGWATVHNASVEVRKANVSEPFAVQLQEQETGIKWRGRFESFRRGHGFLRPLSRSSTQLEGKEELQGIDKGIYVAPSQVERFNIRDGDIVGALVRPPRAKERRRLESAEIKSKDESSWALVRVLDVNGSDSRQRDKGAGTSWTPPEKIRGETFEWTGRVELWRKGHHAFLRPLTPGDEEAVGKSGVFVDPKTVKQKDLIDGDIVTARVRYPDDDRRGGKSLEVQEVLDVQHSSSNGDGMLDTEELVILEGTVEKFRKGFGFVRPLEGATELSGDPRGAFLSLPLMERYGFKGGERIWVRVRPAAPPAAPSATVVEVIQNKGEDSDVWGLLEGNDFRCVDPSLTEGREVLPERLKAMLGVRLHGRVSKVVTRENASGWWGFIKGDHSSLEEELFFHMNDIITEGPEGRKSSADFMPWKGESVFFRVEARYDSHRGVWRAGATGVNFHERHNSSSSAWSRGTQDSQAQDMWTSNVRSFAVPTPSGSRPSMRTHRDSSVTQPLQASFSSMIRPTTAPHVDEEEDDTYMGWSASRRPVAPTAKKKAKLLATNPYLR